MTDVIFITKHNETKFPTKEMRDCFVKYLDENVDAKMRNISWSPYHTHITFYQLWTPTLIRAMVKSFVQDYKLNISVKMDND